MKTILWWGRFDPGYSRNSVVMNLLNDLGWVEAGEPHGLAAMVGNWLTEPEKFTCRRVETRKLFDKYFSEKKLRESLEEMLTAALVS